MFSFSLQERSAIYNDFFNVKTWWKCYSKLFANYRQAASLVVMESLASHGQLVQWSWNNLLVMGSQSSGHGITCWSFEASPVVIESLAGHEASQVVMESLAGHRQLVQWSWNHLLVIGSQSSGHGITCWAYAASPVVMESLSGHCQLVQWSWNHLLVMGSQSSGQGKLLQWSYIL